MTQSLTALSHTLSTLTQDAARSIARLYCRDAPTTGILWSEDGLIVTAQHAVTSKNIGVELADGTEHTASVVGRGGGVALLRVPAAGIPVFTWGDAASTVPGELVIAVSRGERGVRADVGTVCETGPGFRTFRGTSFQRYVETSFAPRPGFSGSVLVRADGTALAMNHAGILRGVPLGIDKQTLNATVGALLQDGHLKRAHLGVGAYPVSLPEEVARERQQERALILHALQPEGPAQGAGLLLGDVLLELGEERLTSMSDLFGVLRAAVPGKSLSWLVLRAGRIEHGELTPNEGPA